VESERIHHLHIPRAYDQQIRRARLDNYEQHVESSITTMAGIALADFIYHESVIQEHLELTGYSSPTWRLQRALQNIYGATCLEGESAITAQTCRNNRERNRGLTVFLWEVLDDQG
jgi:hypothetical protein